MKQTLLTLSVIMAVALLGLLIAAPRPLYGYGSYAQAATAQVTTTVVGSADMASAPTNCGPQPEAIPLAQIGSAVGAWPVWVGLPSQAERAVLAYSKEHTSTESSLPGWWSTKVGWFIKKTYHGTVKLSGFNVADGNPIYFDIGPSTVPTTQPEIDPARPGGFVDGIDAWAFFPSLVWVSKAGCYTLMAQWDGGQWRQTVPAGYVQGW